MALTGALAVGAAPAAQPHPAPPEPQAPPTTIEAVTSPAPAPQPEVHTPAAPPAAEPIVAVAPPSPMEPLLALGPVQTQHLPPLLAAAQTSEPATPGAVAATLADPVVDANAELRGNRTSTWKEGDTQYLLLEQDVEVAVGAYGFRADRAVVRIDTEQQTGRRVRHLSMYLDNARPLRGRGPTQIEASRLLVTASTTGELELETNLLKQERSSDPLVAEAQGRVERRLSLLSRRPLDLQASAVPAPQRPTAEAPTAPPADPAAPPTSEPAPAATLTPPAASSGPRPQDAILHPPATTTAPAPVGGQPMTAPGADGETRADRGEARPAAPKPPEQRIFSPSGIIRFHADKIVLETRGNAQSPQPMILLLGQVRVMYQDTQSGRAMTLTAQSAVLFLDEQVEGVPDQVSAQSVTGIYLEDNVTATDGTYTVRAPRVFYDLKQDKAVVLDAVLYAWDERQQVPIYVRAEQLRQESRTAWSGSEALLSTSDFAEPHFAIGARKITLRQDAAPGGRTQQRYTASGATLRAGNVPVFAWPKISGSGDSLPLRRLDVGYSDHEGPTIETTWDLFALSGQPRPEGVDLLGKIDVLGDHGPGLGVDLTYDMPELRGMFDAYLLPVDNGEDEIGDRRDIPHDGEVRGSALWRHRQQLRANWELSLELGYVSDPTFLEEFRRDEAELSKPYEASLYLKKYEDDWAFTFLSAYSLNDYVVQTPLLQAQASTVDRLPELGYYRIGTSLWEDRLTYFSETRASRLRARFDETSPADRGFSDRQSDILFGFAPATQSFDQVADLLDLPQDYRLRFDTRHELQAPFKAGIVDLAPYVTGRVTAYDDDFDEFSGEEDNYRLWGAVGTRGNTSFSRTYEDVDNRILDLHRMRHIVEPNFDLFMTGSTVDPDDLYPYDRTVEWLAEGFGARAGIRQTLQTQRGGPGRWRTVDWLVLDQSYVYRSDDADLDQPIPRLFSFRPEYSVGGSHFHTEALWLISDTLASASEVIYSFESESVETWRTGLSLEHSPRLTTFIDYTDIDPLASRLMSYGFTYQLTPKWTIGLRHTLDFNGSLNRAIEASFSRRLPQWEFVIVVQHDELEDEQTVGVVLVPRGFGGSNPVSNNFSRVPW